VFGGGGLFEFVYSMDRWKKIITKRKNKTLSKGGFYKIC